jgi:hypothetical protein
MACFHVAKSLRAQRRYFFESLEGTGSHTSNLISESFIGFATPSTRQNAGMSTAGAGCPGPEGGLNVPAATDVADVIEAFVRVTAARLSHER